MSIEARDRTADRSSLHRRTGPGTVDGTADDAAFVARCAHDRVSVDDAPRLAALDPETLTDEAKVDLVRALERVQSCLDAAQQVALSAVVDATEDTGVDGHLARHEVGAALRVAPATAYDRTTVARELTGRMRDTLLAMAGGEIGYWQARSLVEGVRDLSDELAAQVERTVLARASEQTTAETRRMVEGAVVAADPDGAQDRHAAAHARRRVVLQPEPDAMTGLWAAMSAVEASRVWDALCSGARSRRDGLHAFGAPDPGMDALRVDTLIARVTGRDPGSGTGAALLGDAAGAGSTGHDAEEVDPAGAEAGGRSGAGGRRTIGVVVDLATLLGLAAEPCELPGYGPLPPALARELAADADWVRFLTDEPGGELLDVRPDVYRPSEALARFVRQRDRVCGFPGCHVPAQRCDVDHAVDFADGGSTVRANLGPLCRQHHNAKTHGRWQLERGPDGRALSWRSPLGVTYRAGAPPPA